MESKIYLGGTMFYLLSLRKMATRRRGKKAKGQKGPRQKSKTRFNFQPLIYCFFMLVFLWRTSFLDHLLWSIFLILYTVYLKFPAGPLRAVSMYCSTSCPWDLWALLSLIFVFFTTQKQNFKCILEMQTNTLSLRPIVQGVARGWIFHKSPNTFETMTGRLRPNKKICIARERPKNQTKSLTLQHPQKNEQKFWF